MFHNNSPRQVWFRPPAASDLPKLAAGGEKERSPMGRFDLSAARQLFAVKDVVHREYAVVRD